MLGTSAISPGVMGVTHLPVQKIAANSRYDTQDPVVVEEPLEIRLEYGPTAARIEQPVSVTMRTPGQDTELALGFLFTEGILIDTGSIKNTTQKDNSILILLEETAAPDISRLQRHFYTSSSCGVCGKTSIDAIHVSMAKNPESSQPPESPPLAAALLYELPSRLRQGQDLFDSTGGLHAAGLFDSQGRLLTVHEDVGRHNALDKLIGHALLQNTLPLKDHILLLSGRACFELIQKAAMAGIGIVAAVGPPSSLAIRMAQESGITLVGFLRHERFNIYSGAQRIRV